MDDTEPWVNPKLSKGSHHPELERIIKRMFKKVAFYTDGVTVVIAVYGMSSFEHECRIVFNEVNLSFGGTGMKAKDLVDMLCKARKEIYWEQHSLLSLCSVLPTDYVRVLKCFLM